VKANKLKSEMNRSQHKLRETISSFLTVWMQCLFFL